MSDSFELEFKVTEIVDRCRRMETRLTKFLEAQGFDTGTRRPYWKDGTVVIPSADTSMRQILETIPRDWLRDEEVYVSVKGDVVASIYLPTTMPNSGEIK